MINLNRRVGKLENEIGYLADRRDDVEGWARLFALTRCPHNEQFDDSRVLSGICPITGNESDLRVHPYEADDLMASKKLIAGFREHGLDPSMTALAQLEYLHSTGHDSCSCRIEGRRAAL